LRSYIRQGAEADSQNYLANGDPQKNRPAAISQIVIGNTKNKIIEGFATGGSKMGHKLV
jgi:hypothetical protein